MFKKRHKYIRIDEKNDTERHIRWIDAPYQCTRCEKIVFGGGFSGFLYPQWDKSKCLGSPEERDMSEAKDFVSRQVKGERPAPVTELGSFFERIIKERR